MAKNQNQHKNKSLHVKIPTLYQFLIALGLLIACVVLGATAKTIALTQLYIGAGAATLVAGIAVVTISGVKDMLYKNRLRDGDTSQDRINIDKLEEKGWVIRLLLLVYAAASVTSVPVVILWADNVLVTVLYSVFAMMLVGAAVLYSVFVGGRKTSQQRRVLLLVTKQGVRYHTDLAKRTGIDLQEIAAIVKTLEKKGYLTIGQTETARKTDKTKRRGTTARAE